MPSLIVSVEGLSLKNSQGKPKILLRRSRRKIAKSLLNALKVMVNAEYRENHKSAILNYNPFLVLGASNSKWSKAVADLKARLEECLAAKA